MADIPGLAARIAAMLARTRQHAYEPAVVAEAAALILASGDDWSRIVASPAGLAELPPSVAGCLLAYAAAHEEDARPALTIERLEREAARLEADRAYHLARAEELARTAQAADPAYRPALLDQAAAHQECARRDAASASRRRAVAAELGSSGVRAA